MTAFLNVAMGPGADQNRIADYCAGSLEHFDWPVDCGVPFKAEFWSEPGWEPMGDQGLAYSGARTRTRSTPSPSRHHAGTCRRCRTSSRACPAPASC